MVVVPATTSAPLRGHDLRPILRKVKRLQDALRQVVVIVKNRVLLRFRQASAVIGKIAAALLLWVVLVGRKFVVLKAVEVMFGSRVSLDGFAPVTLLIIVLLVSRAAVRRLLQDSRLRV